MRLTLLLAAVAACAEGRLAVTRNLQQGQQQQPEYQSIAFSYEQFVSANFNSDQPDMATVLNTVEMSVRAAVSALIDESGGDVRPGNIETEETGMCARI